MVAALATRCAPHLDLKVADSAYEVYELRRACSLLPPVQQAQEEDERLRARLGRAMDGELYDIEGELTSAFRNRDTDWLRPS
eukprot:15457183-Alexandrium_andersonii.AAC.1